MPKMAGKLRHARKKSVFFASDPKLERLVHNAWLEASLDAPQRVNPVPGYTQGLRRMCVILHVVIPLVKVLLGVLYINECPTNAWLPVYNIVGGCLQFLFLALLIFRGIRKFWVLALIGAAMTIWLFVASVNIFVEWQPDFFRGGWRYCNYYFFMATFVAAGVDYLLLAGILFYTCFHFAFYTEKNERHLPKPPVENEAGITTSRVQ